MNRSNAGFPCAVVYGLLRALPGERAFLPPSLRRTDPAKLGASIAAPGPHDFAVRARLSSSSASLASTASHRAFVTIATRPSHRVRRAELKH